ncbi:MAG: fructose-bisphosphate aldolase [Candidatus Saccharibacteria bacterium]|nr:fructose-bisphosphate aldolase [Candidatus Saccharibacteria bacterium]
MRVLIAGNVIKDIYLDLADQSFEFDDYETPWLSLALNSSSVRYSRRTSVFGGAAATLEALRKLGHDAEICGRNIKTAENGRTLKFHEDKPVEVYRYILTYEDHLVYLTPGIRIPTELATPTEPADWILVDRSAEINEDFLDDLKKYREVDPNVKLAVFANTRSSSAASDLDMQNPGEPGARIFSKPLQTLLRKADLIITDGSLYGLRIKSSVPVFEINDHEIRFKDDYVSYSVENSDLLTDLTKYNILTATVFSGYAEGRDIKDVLELAAINIETARITSLLEREELEMKLTERKEARENIRLIAKQLLSNHKGILAADESGGSIHKKFEEAGIPDDESHRRDYRNIFFTTEGLENYVSGVILFDETARQLSDDGRPFTEYLTSKGIIPGIKVDQGLVNFTSTGYMNEKYTTGLDDLSARLDEYYNMGARFAKWRAAFEITTAVSDAINDMPDVQPVLAGLRTPTKYVIEENARILAEYARKCQDAHIVPIVEPEVVHDGDYSVATCAKVTSAILDQLFKALREKGVDLSACILKVNMVLAGKKFERQSSPEEVGIETAKVLKEHVPAELAGVVFLSGGQTVEQSTDNLAEVIKNSPFPWPVTFSFARALQGPALDAWKGNNANSNAARDAFKARLIANCEVL